jgi:hypothetical protein
VLASFACVAPAAPDDEFGVAPDNPLRRLPAPTRNGVGDGDSFAAECDASGDGEPALGFDNGFGVVPSPVERVGFWPSPSANGPGAVRPGLEWEPPVLCAVPVFASVAAGGLLDVPVAPVVLVELEGGDPLGGFGVDAVSTVEDVCDPVVELAPVVPAPGVDGDSPAPGPDGVDDEPSEGESASATPGELATATPTPSATASAPTRPIYRALPIEVPSPDAGRRSSLIDVCLERQPKSTCARRYIRAFKTGVHSITSGGLIEAA